MRPISILPVDWSDGRRRSCAVWSRSTLFSNQKPKTNRLLSSSKHGYKKSHSTENALGVIADHVLSKMDSGEMAVLVLLDLSKSFDVVLHQGLLDKLELYGMDKEWFADYLHH